MLGVPMPPTPPDSAKGHKTSSSFDRRNTAETTLGYLDDNGKRDTAFIEDLVGGYSAIEIDTPTRRPSLSPNSSHAHGQPVDRVAMWAENNQLDPSRVDSSSRYRNPSAPPSTISSYVPSRHGTLRRSPVDNRSNVSNGFQSLRRGALQDYRNATVSRKESVDDLLGARMTDMISFRLKLHFEDDVRGMVS